MLFTRKRLELPTPEKALPGRAEPTRVPAAHLVLGTPLTPQFPDETERAILGMGCFWGAEEVSGSDGAHQPERGAAWAPRLVVFE